MADEAEAEIDRLYRLPLADFTAARNALAARLKDAGVKSLVKPSVTAWAVNQLYWTARAEFHAVIEAVRFLRTLQQQGAAGHEMREATSRRREAVAAALARAEAALGKAGHNPTPTILQRVGATLEALAVEPAGIRPGRLAQELEPPGFEAIGSLAPAAARPAAVCPPEPGRAAIARAETEVKVRQRAVEAAQAAMQEAQTRLAAAEEGARAARVQVERAEAALAAAVRALSEARS